MAETINMERENIEAIKTAINDYEYSVTCKKCKCEFDLDYTSIIMPRSYDLPFIFCPRCGRTIYLC